MASLPMDFHVKGLVDTLKLGDRMDDVIETMIVLYVSGDTGMFWPLFSASLPSEGQDEAGYAAFEETMITARNKTMVEHAKPILPARQRLHGGRRAASARAGGAGRAVPQGRLHRHGRQRSERSRQPPKRERDVARPND